MFGETSEEDRDLEAYRPPAPTAPEKKRNRVRKSKRQPKGSVQYQEGLRSLGLRGALPVPSAVTTNPKDKSQTKMANSSKTETAVVKSSSARQPQRTKTNKQVKVEAVIAIPKSRRRSQAAVETDSLSRLPEPTASQEKKKPPRVVPAVRMRRPNSFLL